MRTYLLLMLWIGCAAPSLAREVYYGYVLAPYTIVIRGAGDDYAYAAHEHPEHAYDFREDGRVWFGYWGGKNGYRSETVAPRQYFLPEINFAGDARKNFAANIVKGPWWFVDQEDK